MAYVCGYCNKPYKDDDKIYFDSIYDFYDDNWNRLIAFYYNGYIMAIIELKNTYGVC